MSKAKKLHKKGVKFSLFCVAAAQGQAGSSRVKQGQAGSSRVKQGQAGSSRVKRVAAGANSPEATRQIYAKWQGKFKPKS
ncbi:hypothetical protein A0Z17_04890 [Campylobacter upsaliensis]|nr:hypothetical protein [Campylobacter upsaliensis]